jgi:hypothetical protein
VTNPLAEANRLARRRRDNILARRKEAKERTLPVEKEHSRKLREFGRGNSTD